MSELRCSTCGAEAGERAICPQCGTLLAAERGLAKISASTRTFWAGKFEALPRRLTINHFLWLCALMPIVVLPPLATLTFAIFSMRQKATPLRPVNAEWLAIVSLLNILLSLALLYKLHFSPYEVAAFISESVRALLRSLFHFMPGTLQGPRVIPI